MFSYFVQPKFIVCAICICCCEGRKVRDDTEGKKNLKEAIKGPKRRGGGGHIEDKEELEDTREREREG